MEKPQREDGKRQRRKVKNKGAGCTSCDMFGDQTLRHYKNWGCMD
jgi:hypothetical protein